MHQPVAAVQHHELASGRSQTGHERLQVHARLELDMANLGPAREHGLDLGHAVTVALAQRVAEHDDARASHTAPPTFLAARMLSTRSRSAGLSTSIAASAMGITTA